MHANDVGIRMQLAWVGPREEYFLLPTCYLLLATCYLLLATCYSLHPTAHLARVGTREERVARVRVVQPLAQVRVGRLYYIVHNMVHYIVHHMVHCIAHYIVHHMVHCIAYYMVD